MPQRSSTARRSRRACTYRRPTPAIRHPILAATLAADADTLAADAVAALAPALAPTALAPAAPTPAPTALVLALVALAAALAAALPVATLAVDAYPMPSPPMPSSPPPSPPSLAALPRRPPSPPPRVPGRRHLADAHVCDAGCWRDTQGRNSSSSLLPLFPQSVCTYPNRTASVPTKATYGT